MGSLPAPNHMVYLGISVLHVSDGYMPACYGDWCETVSEKVV